MKEFFKKHKIAIFASGGILLLLWLFYEYEQAQAANAATDATTTDPLQVGGTPLVYGTASDGSGGSSPASTGSVLGDYTGSTTAQQIPNTSGSGVPTSSPGNQSTNAASPTVATPTPSSVVAATAAPYQTTTVTQAQADQITAVAKAAVAQSPCAYALNGVNNTGVQTCGPNGYQYSGDNGLASIDPDVNGFFPGQSGYASAVSAQLASTEQMNPGDTQDIQNYEALLSAYGGISVSGDTEGSSVPAGSSQTAAPVTPATPPAYAGSQPATGGRRGGTTAPSGLVQGGVGTSNVPNSYGILPTAGAGGKPVSAGSPTTTTKRPTATAPAKPATNTTSAVAINPATNLPYGFVLPY